MVGVLQYNNRGCVKETLYRQGLLMARGVAHGPMHVPTFDPKFRERTSRPNLYVAASGVSVRISRRFCLPRSNLHAAYTSRNSRSTWASCQRSDKNTQIYWWTWPLSCCKR